MDDASRRGRLRGVSVDSHILAIRLLDGNGLENVAQRESSRQETNSSGISRTGELLSPSAVVISMLSPFTCTVAASSSHGTLRDLSNVREPA